MRAVLALLVLHSSCVIPNVNMWDVGVDAASADLSADGPPDSGGADTRTDRGIDHLPDWPGDVASDSGRDALFDANVDGPPADAVLDRLPMDASPERLALDASPDRSPLDASPERLPLDASPDRSPMDASPEGRPLDTATDFHPDAARDLSVDAGSDSASDTISDVSGDVAQDTSPDIAPDTGNDSVHLYSVENPTLPLDGGAAGCSVWTLVVSSDADDCEVYEQLFLPDGEAQSIYMGSWEGSYTWGTFRFVLPPLPPAVRFVSATLKLWQQVPFPLWDPKLDGLLVRLEDTPQAKQVSSATQAPEVARGQPHADARPVVTRSIRWPPTGGMSWKLEQYNESPDLVSLLEELQQKNSDTSRWTSLQLWLRGARLVDYAEVRTPDYGALGYHAPQLQITWCTP